MKTAYNLFFALVVGIVLSSCGGNQSTDVKSASLTGYSLTDLGNGASKAVKKDGNGLVVEEGYVINGVKNGQWTSYDEGGKIYAVTNYINGKKNGKELIFNKRFQVETMVSYTDDQYDGIYGEYKNGRPEQEVSYKMGQFDGPTRMYFKTGKLQKEVNFKDGKQHGDYRFYDEEGNITVQYKYRDGNKISGGIVKQD